MIFVCDSLYLDPCEVEFGMIRAQGAGGQNVNKVSSAVHLRFDIGRSSLPDDIKARLLEVSDHRISRDGVVVIKSQSSRSQGNNRVQALERLVLLIRMAATPLKPRRATRPTRASQRRRVQRKTERGQVKQLRSKVIE